MPKLSRANRLVNLQMSNERLQKKKSRDSIKGMEKESSLFEGIVKID